MAPVSIDRKLSGAEKAAIFLLALGEARSIRLLERMEEHEVRAIAARTAALRTVDAGVVEGLFREFGSRADGLRPPSQPRPTPRPEAPKPTATGALWDRMGDIPDAVLADLLAKEHPQAAAVVLSKIDARQASRILAGWPKDFAGDVVMRISRLGAVNPGILAALEQSLGAELSTAASPRRPDAAPARAARGPGTGDPPEIGAEAIRSLIGAVEKDKLLHVLSAASDEVRHKFFSAMPERARAMLMEDLAALGPVCARGPDAAGAAQTGLRPRP